MKHCGVRVEVRAHTVENTVMQMIETTEIEMEAQTERVMERILPTDAYRNN